MAPIIYSSPVPSVPLVNASVFTHLFCASPIDSDLVGGYPGSATAFVDAPSRTAVTRAQLKHLALSLGFGLRHHSTTSAQRGDVVLIYSPNSLAWPVVLFGSVAAGLRCTLANSAYTAKELAHQYKDSGAGLVLTSEEGLPTVINMFKDLSFSPDLATRQIIVIGNGLEWAGGPSHPLRPEAHGFVTMQDLLQLGTLKEEEKFEDDLVHETVYLCYSSGTTGKPKGVETTHRNVTSVLGMVKTTFPKLELGTDNLLGFLPFYHIYGAIKLLHFPWICGATVVIMPRFDPVQFCANIEKYKITTCLVVPPVLVVLSRHPAVDKYDITSLVTLFSGAAPLGAALVKQVTQRLEKRNGGSRRVNILQGYGLTETSPTTHLLPVTDALRKVGSIGILLPNLEARLVADETSKEVIDSTGNEPGELWIRGPSIMKGYLNNHTATKASITQDGWFRTGDIAVRDADGYYYIVDRRKELIKYKGFQVPPAELESILLNHPDVADAAVVGVESQREATELPRAYVVHARPQSVQTTNAKAAFQQEIQNWVKTKVAKHKYLRGGVVVIEAIPKSAAGKILRRELRHRAKAECSGREPGETILQAKL